MDHGLVRIVVGGYDEVAVDLEGGEITLCLDSGIADDGGRDAKSVYMSVAQAERLAEALYQQIKRFQDMQDSQ